MKRIDYRSLAVSSVLFMLGCVGPASLDLPWIETRSENFTVYTQHDVQTARGIATDLELFRAAVRHFTNVEQLESPIPVRVFVFADIEHYLEDIGPRGTDGFTLPTSRKYDLVIGGAERDSEAQRFDRATLYHEYVHFLLFNQNDHLLPMWFHEGFAEFLSTVERDGDRLIIGKTPAQRAASLVHGRPMPMLSLLDPTRLPAGPGPTFYSWSWLLVHYLSWEHEYPAGDSFSGSMDAYLRMLGEGLDPLPSFEKAWRLENAELRKRLRGMVDNGVQYGALSIAALDFPQEVEFHTLSHGTSARLIGELALAIQRPPNRARAFFRQALKENARDPRALAGVGTTYMHEQRWESAGSYFDSAIVAGPGDILNYIDRANYRLLRADEETDGKVRNRWVESARSDLAKGRALEPQNPELARALGRSYLAKGQDYSRALEPLEAAFTILPGGPEIQLTLLSAYVKTKQAAKAHELADRLRVFARHKTFVIQIDELLSELRE